jgi:hypothetical protein
MSVEAMTIAALVDEGSSALRTLYASGITEHDFPVYDEEFEWVTKRLARKKPINRRVFRAKFPDFEWMKPLDSVRDLAVELKEERAFDEANALLATLTEKDWRGQVRQDDGHGTRSEVAGRSRRFLFTGAQPARGSVPDAHLRQCST